MNRRRSIRSSLVVIVALAVLAATPIGGFALDPGGTFTDDNGSIHEPAIEAIADAGITKGCNPPVNDMFCPRDVVTREQMATFLVRALDLPAAVGSFVDTAGSVHEADSGALAAAGITKGCNPPVNDMFCPKDGVTREQMASFLTRALKLDISPRLVVSDVQNLGGVTMGTSETESVAQLTAIFGTPTDDYLAGCPYFVNPPNVRYLEWGSLRAAIRAVDTDEGPLGLMGWRYKLDLDGDALPGGPSPEHVVMPDGVELLDPIGDASAVSGTSIELTEFTSMTVNMGYYTVEATGLAVDPGALIDGVQQGLGYFCGG